MKATVKAGDDLEIRLSLVDRAGAPVDLAGVQAVTWVLARLSGQRLAPPVLTKALGAGVAITSETNGRFTITVQANETAPLRGAYAHKTRVVDASGRTVTAFYPERGRHYDLLSFEPEHFTV